MYSLKIENSYMLMICKRQACKPSCCRYLRFELLRQNNKSTAKQCIPF